MWRECAMVSAWCLRWPCGCHLGATGLRGHNMGNVASPLWQQSRAPPFLKQVKCHSWGVNQGVQNDTSPRWWGNHVLSGVPSFGAVGISWPSQLPQMYVKDLEHYFDDKLGISPWRSLCWIHLLSLQIWPGAYPFISLSQCSWEMENKEQSCQRSGCGR